MPNPDGSPTPNEITARRTEVFSYINTHNQYLIEKEFIDCNDRDGNDVRVTLKNMRRLAIMERDIGRYEDDGQRARSLYMLSKSVSHLYFRVAPSQIDPLSLYRNYKRIEERSIWYDLDFLRICGQYGELPRLKITPGIINNILSEDLPKLRQIIDIEFGADDALKQQRREEYGNTKNLPHLYKIANFHRTKISLEKSSVLIDQATGTAFDLYNEKQRFAFCRLLTEIGECFTKKNLTDTAKRFFNSDDLDALSSLRNSLTHFNLYLHKDRSIFDVLVPPNVVGILEDIRAHDLPILRNIVTGVMHTVAHADNVSDTDFDNLMLRHFSYIKDKTFEEIRNKLSSIHDNNDQAVLADNIITNLMGRLSNLGIILNNDIAAGNDYRREIETEIRKINPQLLGNRAIKNILGEITCLVNTGVQNFRNDPPLGNTKILADYLVAIKQQPNAKEATEVNSRKIQTIDILSNMLRPVPHLFREVQRSFTEDVVHFDSGQGRRSVELDAIPLTDIQKRAYRMAVFKDDANGKYTILSTINFGAVGQERVIRDTQKYNAFDTMCNSITQDLYTRKSLEFILAGLQEIVNNEVNLTVDIKRQLRGCRNSLAHHEVLMTGTDNVTFNLRYASIYIKEVKPQLQQLQEPPIII